MTAVVVGGVESGSCSGGNCYFKGSEGGFIAVGVGLLALGGLSIASAATGYDRTSDCRRMQETPASRTRAQAISSTSVPSPVFAPALRTRRPATRGVPARGFSGTCQGVRSSLARRITWA